MSAPDRGFRWFMAQDQSGAPGSLSDDEMRRLALFKWRYVLENDGFAADQARRLLFVKWLYLQGLLSEAPPG